MSANLTINFTPAITAPANGYIVSYRAVGETAYQVISPNPTASPVIIPGLVFGASYEGNIKSSCSSGLTSEVLNFQASPVFNVSEIGVLIVDINARVSSNILAYIDTPGISENSVVCYPETNFTPSSTIGSPNTADIICSDFTDSQSFSKLRFEFNIKKHLQEYPLINTFIYRLAGRDIISGEMPIIYNLKGANDSIMIMGGSPGSYYPSVVNSTYPFTAVNATMTIGLGANGLYDTSLPILKTFTYDRSTRTITLS
jgi:hypothetical protein